MVREVKPLTSVVPVDQDGQSRPPVDPPAAKRRGTLVLEVQDPDAVAALGEQLSLAHELLLPLAENEAKPPARARKTTTKSTTQKSAARKTATQRTSTQTRASRKPSTTSQAKQKNAVAASLTVPIAATTEQQMCARVQQLGTIIDNLQTRLEHLHYQAAADSGPSTQRPASSPTQSSQPPRLPDWSEPELRPHYTLQESARIYGAIEALHQHRTLQTAADVEMSAAQAIAERLRQSRDPRPNSGMRPTARQRSAKIHHRVGLMADQLPHQRQRAHRRGRRQARWRWDVAQFRHNLCQLGQRLMSVPAAPGAKIVDSLVWVLVTIGLRLLLNGLMQVIPAIAGPLNLLMAIPAILAAYLAFCVDNSRADPIYRLLLVAFGLFLGGRL